MSSEGNSDDRLKKLFVGGLNRSTSDETLKAYFEEYGELSDCVVIRDSGTKESRGFGYVTYKDPSSVIPVLQYKRDTGPHKIDGKEVEVKRAIPREDQSSTAHLKTKKIFIGGLADAATAEDIRSALAENLRNIAPTSVDLIMRKSDDGQAPSKHRGFCFVEFDDEDLVDELCCIKKIDICGKKVDTKAAMMLMAVDMIPLTLMPPRVMVLAMMLMEAWECTNRLPQVMVHSSHILVPEAEEEGDTGPTRT